MPCLHIGKKGITVINSGKHFSAPTFVSLYIAYKEPDVVIF